MKDAEFRFPNIFSENFFCLPSATFTVIKISFKAFIQNPLSYFLPVGEYYYVVHLRELDYKLTGSVSIIR
ncbi:MAG: hypothetical protein EAZ32_01200 [Cytophagia bacterium]|nr:MAG: hypothetical protein EAZ38_00815 [Cytophagales bacterium]TAG42345.1 MAG: hypothetical protein EAZ32_01200 [Cytophagia bacterium]TAG57047.1 MAG: hypothetical protein EAZ29_02455 [Runella slithyformis]TAG84234.1 MAG: hypothetical protein EAZ22_00970 [Cytophagales bacterium]